MRRQLAISAALALVGMLWGAATAESAHGEVDVRIAARRLDDGRTEFALQQRGADGLWRERLLPAARFFPPETPVGRWLSSSALTVGITGMLEGPDGPSGSVELRIAAQRLQGGRMEFALHRRQSTGHWSERILPGTRFLPAVPESGSWLVSSELAVSTSAQEPDPPHSECTPEAVASRVSGSVALVRAGRNQGTAFFIGNGEWLTAAHVVPGAPSVQLLNGSMDITATVTGLLADTDLAILGIEGDAVPIPWGAAPQNGAESLLLGYGLGQRTLTAGVTRGIISEQFTLNGESYIRTDAPANPGNSGGPLLNRCGQVIGLILSKVTDESVEGVAYAISAESIRALLPSLRTAGPVGPPQAESDLPEIAALCRDRQEEDWPDAETCRASAAAGLPAATPLLLMTSNLEDPDEARYRIDGGDPVEQADLSLRGLRVGSHTIEVRERRTGGWTAWSPPHAFQIRARSSSETRSDAADFLGRTAVETDELVAALMTLRELRERDPEEAVRAAREIRDRAALQSEAIQGHRDLGRWGANCESALLSAARADYWISRVAQDLALNFADRSRGQEQYEADVGSLLGALAAVQPHLSRCLAPR